MLFPLSLLSLSRPVPGKEEVVLILSNPAKFGLVRTEVLPPEGIANGTVYLCSKVCLLCFVCVENATKKSGAKILSKLLKNLCVLALAGRAHLVLVREEENKG